MLSHVENVVLGNTRRCRASKPFISKGKTVYSMILALIIVSSILASQNASALDLNIEDFQWKKRLLLIFSPHRADPLFNSLAIEISSRPGDVEDRDLVIFEILESEDSKMSSGTLNSDKPRHAQDEINSAGKRRFWFDPVIRIPHKTPYMRLPVQSEVFHFHCQSANPVIERRGRQISFRVQSYRHHCRKVSSFHFFSFIHSVRHGISVGLWIHRFYLAGVTQ
jgi:hypothetical protein